MSAATCEKCGTEPGHPYTFLYGTVTTTPAGPNTTRVTQEITGRQTVSLGERCVEAFRVRKLRKWRIAIVVWSALILTGIGLIVFASSDGPKIVGLLGGAVAAIGLIIALIMNWSERKSTKQTHGEELGIELHKKELKKQGYSQLYSQQGWQDHMNATNKMNH
ncbi:MAG: hypothetical protein WD770_09115 [Actinomycetota bacterium]